MKNTSLPMSRALIGAAAAAVLALSLSACGGDDNDKGDGGSKVSVSQLEDALLTADDLPDGFSPVDSDDDDDSASPFDGTCFADVTDALDAQKGDHEADAKAEQEFGNADDTSSVQISAAYFEDPSVYGELIDTVDDLLGTCTSVQTTTEQGVDIDLTITSEQGTAVSGADEQLEFGLTGTISAEGQSFPISVQAAIAIAGKTGASVMTYALGEDVVTDQTAALTQQQLENVAQYR